MQARAQTPPPEQVEEGARLYAENCAVCHGPDGEGRVGVTLAKNWPSIRPDATVKNAIANGVDGSPMPAWSQENGGPLTEAEIDALTAFILTLGSAGFPELMDFPTPTAHPPITPVAEVEGNPNNGAVLYAENCAMCHGDQGEGRIGATLAKDWPSIRPDLSIKTVIQNGVDGSPMVAWSQEKGGPMSEAQINDLVAYIVVLPNTGAPAEAPPAAPSEPQAPAWLLGVVGLGLFFLALIVVVGGVLLFQRRN
jgi:mono/diheme cytochrome c family protein